MAKKNFYADNKRGSTAIEYCLLAAMFAVVCIGAVLYFRDSMNDMYGTVNSAVNSANSN